MSLEVYKGKSVLLQDEKHTLASVSLFARASMNSIDKCVAAVTHLIFLVKLSLP